MKKIIIVLVILSMSGFAQEFKKTGTAGFTFLEIPATARTAALGETSIALPDMNSAAVFSNPGALGFTRQVHSFSINYSPWFADIKNYATSYSYRSDAGVIGIGALVLDYGTMPRTVKLSGQKIYEKIGTFSANAMALGLTYSKQLTDKFSFGVSVKYVNEKIDIYNASNVLMDGGILYYTGLSSVRIGASVQNFGTNAKFRNSSFKMPALFRIGAAADILQDDNHRLTMAAEAVHPTDADERLNFGMEYVLMDMISLRGGYKFFYDEEKFNFGAGIKIPSDIPAIIDFSMSDFGRLGNIIRFSLHVGTL